MLDQGLTREELELLMADDVRTKSGNRFTSEFLSLLEKYRVKRNMSPLSDIKNPSSAERHQTD